MSAAPHLRDTSLIDQVIAHLSRHGAGDTRLETLATALGLTPEALVDQVGSRERLLMGVVGRLERQQQQQLAELLATHDDPYDAAAIFWRQIAGAAPAFAPLFFELSALAMRRPRTTETFRRRLSTAWVDVLADGIIAAGGAPDHARRTARVAMATTRGVIFDLAMTGDRTAADQAMAEFLQQLRTAI